MSGRTGKPPAPGGRSRPGPRDQDRAERELDDALYYLREGCEPCAERHFSLARRFGATDEQIARVRLAGAP
jgi:Carboxymuconolactone decarboxylase family